MTYIMFDDGTGYAFEPFSKIVSDYLQLEFEGVKQGVVCIGDSLSVIENSCAKIPVCEIQEGKNNVCVYRGSTNSSWDCGIVEKCGDKIISKDRNMRSDFLKLKRSLFTEKEYTAMLEKKINALEEHIKGYKIL